ncbi:RNA-directed DNA polymerase, eukaryota, reverse transcriptase zinc-binding domain protein [Tanacetum coccineum]
MIGMPNWSPNHFPNNIQQDKQNTYDWKPNACTHCKVFGHEFKGCTKRPRTPEEEEDMKRKEEALSKLKNDNMDTSGEQDRWKKASFRQYNYKGYGNQNDTRAGKNNKGVFGNNFGYKRQEYRRKQTDNKRKESDGTNDKKEGNKKQWPLKQNEFEAMKKTANKKIQSSVLEISNWSNDMIKCFKENSGRRKRFKIASWNIRGMSTGNKQKEVRNLIRNEKIQEILWKDLYMHRRASSTLPWAIMGDMNVTLKVKEHSNGGSSITEDMQDFIDCVNQVEVDDIGSTGFFYTWTKSRKNPNNSTLKKLDRVMVSEHFLTEFEGSYAVFQPFLVSDHSPAILVIPHNFPKKPK